MNNISISVVLKHYYITAFLHLEDGQFWLYTVDMNMFVSLKAIHKGDIRR